MNHANPDVMRAKARDAVGFLKNQLVTTGNIEPLVALLFHDHIEQVQFEDPSVLEHFDLRTMKGFDYLRNVVRLKQPQAAMIALDVRMGRFESEEVDAVPDTTAIFFTLDSPLLTIQVIVLYVRSGDGITLSREQFTESASDEDDVPCPLFTLFSRAPALAC
jgi:hypothetical protein